MWSISIFNYPFIIFPFVKINIKFHLQGYLHIYITKARTGNVTKYVRDSVRRVLPGPSASFTSLPVCRAQTEGTRRNLLK